MIDDLLIEVWCRCTIGSRVNSRQVCKSWQRLLDKIVCPKWWCTHVVVLSEISNCNLDSLKWLQTHTNIVSEHADYTLSKLTPFSVNKLTWFNDTFGISQQRASIILGVACRENLIDVTQWILSKYDIEIDIRLNVLREVIRYKRVEMFALLCSIYRIDHIKIPYC